VRGCTELTIKTGAQMHYGNNVALIDPLHPGDASPSEATQNQTSLAAFFDTSHYLASTSDIVALMTLEHQTRMNNLLVHRVGRAHRALRQEVGRRADELRDRADGDVHAVRG